MFLKMLQLRLEDSETHGRADQGPGGNLQRAISRSFDALNPLQQVSGATQ